MEPPAVNTLCANPVAPAFDQAAHRFDALDESSSMLNRAKEL
jgi:hypothetical protein